MSKYIIKQVTVGYGITILTPGGGNVYKYYLEPTVEFEVPAETSADELQTTLDQIGDELLSKVRVTIHKKAQADKQAREAAQKERDKPSEG